jgi:hypothetical protein
MQLARSHPPGDPARNDAQHLGGLHAADRALRKRSVRHGARTDIERQELGLPPEFSEYFIEGAHLSVWLSVQPVLDPAMLMFVVPRKRAPTEGHHAFGGCVASTRAMID